RGNSAPADDTAATTTAAAVTTSTTATTTVATTTTTETTATTTTTTATTVTTTRATTASTTKTAPTTAATAPPDTTGHYVQTNVPAWNLRLVNGWNPLPEDYDYEANLIDFGSGRLFDVRAAEALRNMIAAGKAHGIYPVSLFRPYALQVKLFNNETAEWKRAGYSQAEAEQKASTEVARPGTSEHHMGLAADLLSNGYSSLVQSYDKTDGFKWLKEHCAEYGFILRYPKEKEHITGVIYEPWHYRYVGVEAATVIMSRGICLEEYLAETYG
ncbi:MAG: D-alanyl-D-alanine carboxypeptidase family protein, partial [Ruminococcaceae bacterium]|nr:D-alanyl-D-alanine carboxypeptidase family protein [Oscillospiraceae bacterium]